jgi:hypothetical protein
MSNDVKMGGAYIDVEAKLNKLEAQLNTAVAKTETAAKKMETALKAVDNVRPAMLKQFVKELQTLDMATEGVNASIQEFITYNKLSENEINKVINVLKKQQSALAIGSNEYKQHAQAIQSLSGAANNVRPPIDNLAKSHQRLAGSQGNGMSSLTQFNRIIQDSPYGIIGVTNNIQAFSEQFGYLVKQTGGAKAALSAMLGSLTGAGGIMLGITAVTTALQLYTMYAGSAKEGTDELNESTKELIGTIKDMLKVENPFKKIFPVNSTDMDKVVKTVKSQIKVIKDNIKSLQSGSSAGAGATSVKIDTSGLIKEEQRNLEIKQKVLESLKSQRDITKQTEEVYKSLIDTGLEPEQEKTKEIQTQLATVKEMVTKYSEMNALSQLFGKYTGVSSASSAAKANGKSLSPTPNIGKMNEVAVPEKPQILLTDKDQKEWEDQNKFLVSSMQDSLNIIGSNFSTLWQGIFGEANSVFEQIAQMIANKLIGSGISWLLDLILLGSGTAASAAVAAVDGRASGGSVYSNTPYIVGEQGPELYVPKSSGTIIPAGQTQNILGGRSGKIDELIKSVQAMNANVTSAVIRKNNSIAVTGELTGSDIYLSNKRTTKRMKRMG